MRYILQWILSLVFVIQMYGSLVVISIVYFPYAILSRKGAQAACLSFGTWVVFSAKWLIGLTAEIRGEVPDTGVLIASKHQSFFDIILLFSVLRTPRFVMKSELRWVPFLGYYALRIGCVPVNRGKRGAAIAKMISDVKSGYTPAGQLIIYPQGTRVPPGVQMPYKVGTAILYRQLGQPCVPVATNVGLFWPKRGIYRKPGRAVLEFLPIIPPGEKTHDFMACIEDVVETASNALMEEVDFSQPVPAQGKL
ncbi:MAG: lysophospholipid acyltransferase family protein [Paracoccaceae bacterium]|jgi:1-acyl-sn-glycerol-3-phosphate acyltransferase